MGFEKVKADELENSKEYIFELGLREFFSKVKPGEQFDGLIKRLKEAK